MRHMQHSTLCPQQGQQAAVAGALGAPAIGKHKEGPRPQAPGLGACRARTNRSILITRNLLAWALWNRVPVQGQWLCVGVEELSAQRSARKQKHRSQERNKAREKEVRLVVRLVAQPSHRLLEVHGVGGHGVGGVEEMVVFPSRKFLHYLMARIPVDLAPTGALALFPGRTLGGKYSPPSDAWQPQKSSAWHLFCVFPDAKTRRELALLNGKSFTLVGRQGGPSSLDYAVQDPYADLVSKEHCVFQFRGSGKLYVIDLRSTNGTWLNGIEIPPERYVELRHGDRVRLGEWDFEDEDSHAQIYEGVEFVVVED